MNAKKPILVTGSHRSGSTWVGRMIAQSPAVGYIHEPFNSFNTYQRPGFCGARFEHWFTYISAQNEAGVYDQIRKMVNFSYNFRAEIAAFRSWKDPLRMIRDAGKFFAYRAAQRRPLIKDPIAIFSAEWLASRFNMDVVVLIRHPAAFAGSLKVPNWAFPFSHFLEQPLLMADHLYPFADEIRTLAEKGPDIIDQAILLWRLIHYMILKFRADHDDWLFVRHEDLAKDPMAGFQMLFDALHLAFTDEVRAAIREHSQASNPNELSPAGGSAIRRDSKAIISNWKHRLTAEEIARIRTQTTKIASEFYSDEDW